MSKERLEEILRNITYLNRISGMPKEVSTYKGQETVVPVFTKDVEHLIERVQELEEIKNDAIEQIDVTQRRNRRLEERVQELEEESYNAHLERLLDRKEQQNKRYREVIKETLQAMGMVDRQKYGSKLEKALEGEK